MYNNYVKPNERKIINMTKLEISDILIEKVEQLQDAKNNYDLEKIQELINELDDLYSEIRESAWKD